MNALQEALRIEAMDRGYSFPTIAYAQLDEPRISITKVIDTARAYNLEISDYMRDLPEPLAQALAVSVLDYFTGGSPSIPEAVRTYIRETCRDKYLKRKAYIKSEEVRRITGLDLDAIADALKRNGQLGEDIIVAWTEDRHGSHISPTFRVIAIPLYLLEEPGDGEVITEILANYRIMQTRTGARA